MATLLHKYSASAGVVPAPAEISPRELAVNTADGKLFTKKDDGTVVEIGAAGAAAPAGAQYVVMASDATLTDERVLTAGNHVTVVNGGGLATVDWRYNPAKRAIMETECNGQGVMSLAASGTGAVISYAVAAIHDSNRFGIAQFNTGTTATGRAALSSTTTDCIVLGGGIVKYCAIVRVPVLSDATNTFLVQCGLHDNVSGAAVDGLYFEYSHGLNAGDWTTMAYTNSLGSPTGFDTNVAVATGNWYRLEIEVNAAATQAIFSINGSVVQTYTGTMPSGATRATGFFVNIRKTVGTTARNLYVDYIGCTMEVSR